MVSASSVPTATSHWLFIRLSPMKITRFIFSETVRSATRSSTLTLKWSSRRCTTRTRSTEIEALMAFAYTVHCVICHKTWVVSSRYETNWLETHVYDFCGVCRKLLMEEFERQMSSKLFNPPRMEDDDDAA